MLRSIQYGQDRFIWDHKGFFLKEGALPSSGSHMKIGALKDSFNFFHSSGRNLLAVALIALAAYAYANRMLGIVGLLLRCLLVCTITRSAWRAAKNLKGTVWFPFRFAIFWCAFLLVFPLRFYGFIVYQDFVMNAYFCLMLGMLFRVSEFPRNLPIAQTTA